jgi:hypothetical protein
MYIYYGGPIYVDQTKEPSCVIYRKNLIRPLGNLLRNDSDVVLFQV